MTTQIVTTEWRTMNANKFMSSITNYNNFYYMFAGHHVPVNVTPLLSYDVLDSSVDVYNNMIFGKIVKPTDVALVIRNIPYTANTVFTAFDDGDPVLLLKDFYVVVDTGTGGFKHVFKCLDNNNNNPSTVPPNFADVNPSDESYRTSDGYRWKYMYSIDQSTYNKFTISSGLIPVVANSIVQAAAIPGAIDVIAVSNTGAGYNNYLKGTFGTSDCRVSGNTRIYGLSSNNIASQIAGFYTGCLLYISTGNGIGQNKTVVDFFANSSGSFILVDSEFSIPPTNGSNFEIYPSVVIVGDGNQSVNAVARAVVNAVGNTIARVEMLSLGQSYTFMSATVTANDVVGVTSKAVVRPVYAPAGGHGSDPAVELGATSVAISVTFANNEGNTIPTQNGFRQIGLIQDPLFANVAIGVSNVSAVFLAGETVQTISTVTLFQNATANNGTFSANTGFFDQQIEADDWVFLYSSDKLFQSLVQVNAVINSSTVSLTSNLSWACTTVTVAAATLGPSYLLKYYDGANTMYLDGVPPSFGVGAFLVGASSGATAVANTITRNGVPKSFDTFVQLSNFVGTLNGGTFVLDEQVYQGTSLANSTANAYLHSVVTTGGIVTVFVSDPIGLFQPGVPMIGATSQASFTFNTQYCGEITPRSAPALFIENTNMMDRANNESENITIVMDF